MDLVSLIAACAMNVDARLMHALVWNESGGEPWSVRAGSMQVQPYESRTAALEAAVAAHKRGRPIKVGLVGVQVNVSGTTQLSDLFEPCFNIAVAAGRLTELETACRQRQREASAPQRCALAHWRGSAKQGDFGFADRVLADARSGQLPNFDLPAAQAAEPAGDTPSPPEGPEPDQEAKPEPPADRSLFFRLNKS